MPHFSSLRGNHQKLSREDLFFACLLCTAETSDTHLLLFHTCLMAKEKKVCTRNTITYASSSDDESSDDEIDYASLFKGLDRTKIGKINELIDALNDKNRLLEKQEDLLYEEHDKLVEAQKSLALEVPTIVFDIILPKQ